MAAHLGDSRGFLNLAHIQDTIYKNNAESLKNYERAADLGNEIAKNILALKGISYLPSMKRNVLNAQSNISKILNNNSQLMLEDNTQNSFALNQSKQNGNKIKVPPLPLISSYISSGIPKQLVHKQMMFENSIENQEKTKHQKGLFEDHKKHSGNRHVDKKQNKKINSKENITPNMKAFYEEEEAVLQLLT